MARPLARALTAFTLAVALIGLTGVPASAERWWGRDRAGDVRQIGFSPEPPPCGTVSESATPQGASTEDRKSVV